MLAKLSAIQYVLVSKSSFIMATVSSLSFCILWWLFISYHRQPTAKEVRNGSKNVIFKLLPSMCIDTHGPWIYIKHRLGPIVINELLLNNNFMAINSFNIHTRHSVYLPLVTSHVTEKADKLLITRVIFSLMFSQSCPLVFAVIYIILLYITIKPNML